MMRKEARVPEGILCLLLAAACGQEPKGGPAPLDKSAEVPAPNTAAPASSTALEAPEEPVAARSELAPERYEAGLDQLDAGVDLSRLELAPAAGGEDPTRVPLEAESGQIANPLESLNRVFEMKGGMSLLEGEQPTKEFGTVRQGEVREHVFRFVSDGEEPLIVKAIKPSCGCTKAEIKLLSASGDVLPYEKGASIPIGQEFQLLTEASTDGKGPGAFGAQVSVYSNAPGSPYNVRLSAQIEPVLVIEPDHQLFLGQITTVERKEADVTVYSKRGERFSLKEDLGPLAAKRPIALELAPENPDAEGKSDRWKVHVIAGPGLEIGMVNAPLQLLSDLPIPNPKYPNPDGSVKCYPVMIAVQARVMGLVGAEPAFVSFGMVRPGQAMERAVRIECRDEFQLPGSMPVQIEGLYGGEFPYAQSFATEFGPVEAGRVDLKLKLLGLPKDLNGSFGGILKVSVGHPSMAEVSVRFSGVCRPGTPADAPTSGTGN